MFEAHQSFGGRDGEARARLPYARHLNEHVVVLDTQAMMICLRLDGVSFETADVRDLNDWHEKLNAAWRNMADERLAIWHHLVRRRHSGYPPGRFVSAFAKDLDGRYRAELERTEMFVNELYVTLVVHPGRGASERFSAWFAKTDEAFQNQARVQRLEDAARDLIQHLTRYGARKLSIRQHDGAMFSEPMALLRLVLTGRHEPAPLPRGHMGAALLTERLIFGREAIELRGPAETRFAGMFGVKEYPAATRPGLWNGLLAQPFEFVASQSFAFLSKAASRAILERKENQMLSAHDRASSQIAGLDQALDDLTSSRFAMGEHQASLLVYGRTPTQLADNMAKARAVFAESGLVAAREDLGLEAAYWAQAPGAFRLRLRPAAITTRNFAALAPFHTHPCGREQGNHWGPALVLLRTAAGSPYHFSLHVGDLGHTFICGPSGSGKTIVQNFLLAQLEKFGVQQVFIDKDRGAEIFVRARAGSYHCLRNGVSTGFAPLKALEFTPANQVFLGVLIRQLVGAAERPLSPSEEVAIDQAILALAPLPRRARSLAALRTLLGQRSADGLGARLAKWCNGAALGWVLDNDEDELAFKAELLGFDMTHLLDNAEIRGPVMSYLFHRLTGLVDGRRLVIDIDEFWKALGDEAFRALAQDGLKTFRKQNAVMVFGTQSAADVLRSPIAHTILEQCATKIFLPNPHAAFEDYVQGFGLSQREYALVRHELSTQSRRFLIKQDRTSVVAELRLDDLADDVAVLSGRAETVELLDQLRARHGDDPAAWLPPFHKERKRTS